MTFLMLKIEKMETLACGDNDIKTDGDLFDIRCKLLCEL